MNDLWVASLILLWVVVLVLSFLLAGALRQLGMLHLRFGDDPGALITETGLDRGVVAPDFSAVEPETGHALRLSDMLGVARVLVFMSPNCVSCRQLVPHLNEVLETRRTEFDFVVLCRGDRKSCVEMARITRLRARMLVDESGAIERAYGVTLTPFSYLLDHQGRVLMRGIANTWRQLEALIDQEGTQEGGAAWETIGNGDGTNEQVERAT